MDIHQKNVRQQEQERQWKQLQASRAREQQLQQLQSMPEKMLGNFEKKKKTMIHARSSDSVIHVLDKSTHFPIFTFDFFFLRFFQLIKHQTKCKFLLITITVTMQMMQPMEL